MPSKARAQVRSDVQPKALKCGQLMRRARPCGKTRPAKWPYAAPGILSVIGRTRKRLYQHPAVIQAGVIGKPHPVYGEQVVAFVSLREGQEISEQQLMEFARKRLAD